MKVGKREKSMIVVEQRNYVSRMLAVSQCMARERYLVGQSELCS